MAAAVSTAPTDVSHPDAGVEAEAVQKLNDLKAGKITIGDILGPLYSNPKVVGLTASRVGVVPVPVRVNNHLVMRP